MSLSQDEINALMGGAASNEDATDGDAAEESSLNTGDNAGDGQDAALLDEIVLDDALADVALAAADSVSAADAAAASKMQAKALTPDEIDVLGEIGNICMGAVATTMYTLLDRRVSITTPRVSLHTPQEVLTAYEVPFVVVRVEYVEGINGNNLLVLREEDAALITDLLMGGDGTVEEPIVLTELHLSAISEIMNQMMGASSTALSKLMHTTVNISPPQSMNVSPDKDVSVMLDNTAVVIKISFDMEIEGLLKSELLQILPYELGLDLAEKFMQSGMGVPAANVEKVEIPRGTSAMSAAPQAPQVQQVAQAPVVQEPVLQYAQPAPMQEPLQMPQYAPQAPQYAPPPQYAQQPYPGAVAGYPQQPYANNAMPYQQSAANQGFVDVHPMSYQAFDSPVAQSSAPKSIDMIYDIPLQVTVELGKARKEISEILEFGTGTIIVLDKIAGDPVEIIVNGKLIARGEVVVIEDNYGVRITEILNN